MSEVRKELKKIDYGINWEIELLKMEENFSLLRIENDEVCYLVKYFPEGIIKEKIALLFKLEKLGIETGVVTSTNKVIILKDYERSGFYRKVTSLDLKNQKFIEYLASWYNKMHSIDVIELFDQKAYFRDEIFEKFREYKISEYDEIMDYVYKNYDNIKLKLYRAETCVVCGNISLENIMISKDYGKIFVDNFDNLKEGLRYSDIEKVYSLIGKENIGLFIEKYGEISQKEILINDTIKLLLNFSSKKHSGAENLEVINNSDLLASVKTLVEWY